MENYIITTQNLTKQFGHFKATDSINLHVKEGAIYGLIGRNGAGKTTLMKILTGMSTQTSGEYSILGKSGKDLGQVRDKIGSHIEAPALYPEMTAADNLKLKCIQRGVYSKEYVQKLLDTVGLPDVGKKKAGRFSLGMKQRLGIAMALVGDPDILVLDEPINGLDPQGIHEVRDILLKLNRERGITIIISSHILDELSRLATDYGIIHEGRLVEEISVKELEELSKEKVILITNNNAEAAKLLEKQSIEYTFENNAIIINGHISESAAINRMLIENGIDVSEIKLFSDSLEDHYLKITGGNN